MIPVALHKKQDTQPGVTTNGKATNNPLQLKQPANNPLQQRAKGTAGPVAQRYFDMSQWSIGGYGKGKGAAAPQFEFQKQKVIKTPNDTTSTMSYNMDTMQHFEDAPDLKVSDNYDMAVPNAKDAESKSFFATQTVINASNLDLVAAGAPLTLVAGAGRITLPSRWNPFASNPLIQVIPTIAPHLITSSECGVFAQNILGINVNNIHLLTGMAGAPVVTNLPQNFFGSRDAPLNTALGGQAPENIGANKNADPQVGEGFGIFSRTTVPPLALAQRIWNDITTVHGLFKEKRNFIIWGEHWAGVVAKSGGDYVTLENYNRAVFARNLLRQQLEKDYTEIDAAGGLNAFRNGTTQYASPLGETAIQRLARLFTAYMKYAVQIQATTGFYAGQLQNMWYFAMYGKENQSFHETWKSSASDAVTAVVR